MILYQVWLKAQQRPVDPAFIQLRRAVYETEKYLKRHLTWYRKTYHAHWEGKVTLPHPDNLYIQALVALPKEEYDQLVRGFRG